MLSVYDLKGGVKWTKMLGQLSLPTEKPNSNALLTIVTVVLKMTYSKKGQKLSKLANIS